MEAEIQAAWFLNVFKLLEVFDTELLFRRVKIKISSKSVLPVVLISSSTGQSEGSDNLNKHSASRFHLFIMSIVSAVSQVSVAIHRPSLGQVFGLVISTFLVSNITRHQVPYKSCLTKNVIGLTSSLSCSDHKLSQLLINCPVAVPST